MVEVAILNLIYQWVRIDADTVAANLRPRLGSVTVHILCTVLPKPLDAEAPRRIVGPDSTSRIETLSGANTLHLVCQICGRAFDRAGLPNLPACLSQEDARTYQIHRAETTYRGVCADCSGEQRHDAPSDDRGATVSFVDRRRIPTQGRSTMSRHPVEQQ